MLVEDARAVPGSASSKLTVFTDWVVFINGSAVALKAYIEATEQLKPLLDVVERFDRELGKQMRRSATSVPLNIAEGSYSQGKNRNARLYNALGSAKETCAALKVSVAWGYLDRAQIQKCYTMYDMIVATLYKLVKHRNR